MEPDYVSLKDLAQAIGLDRSNTRKYVLKLGIKPQKRRTPGSANQLALTLTRVEADAVVRHRAEHGFLSTNRAVEGEIGVFYIIQLVPELEPRRVKLGFANDIGDRLGQHRTAAPTAHVLKTWPCRRSWELTAMDALTADHCRLVTNEVFEADDLHALVAKGDAFFGVLPDPGFRLELSVHSPLHHDNQTGGR